MTGGGLASLAPLALAGAAGIAAMVLAPLAREAVARGVAAAGLALGLVVLLARAGAPAAPATDLLADDALARLGAGLALLAGLGVLGFGPPARGAPEAAALVALATAGAIALSAAEHAATLFLGLEITTLSLVALAVTPRSPGAVEAGYKLFLMAGTAAAGFLLGLALLFAATGSLTLAALSGPGVLVGVATALILAALAFKLSLVPFHMWAPDLFAGAPAAAGAVAGAISKIAVGIALVRIAALVPAEPVWSLGLGLCGAAAALFGNLLALRQQCLLRMLGYSSIAHSGYMALALASGADLGPQAVLVYLLTYAPAVIASLGVAALLGGAPTIDDLKGLAWRTPLVGVALAVALLSMAGLPPTAGFLGKFYIFSALVEAEAWLSLAAAGGGSALAFYYYLRFATRCFAAAEDGRSAAAAGWPAATTLAVATALLIVTGFYPEPMMVLARIALP